MGRGGGEWTERGVERGTEGICPVGRGRGSLWGNWIWVVELVVV